MVRNADGSVIIDTGLDSSGVDIGAKEVEKRINAFISSIDKFGARLQKATAGYATNAGEILSREYTKGFEGAAAKLRDMAAAQIPTDGYRQVTTEIEKAEAALDKLQQKQEKLKAMGADQTSYAWQKVQQDIDDTTAKLEEQRAKVQEVKDTLKWALSEEHRQEVHAEGPEVWGQYVEEMEALKQVATEGEAEIQKMENSLAKLTAKQEQMKASGADLGSKQWQSLQYDIEQVTEKIAQLRAEKEKMESDGSAFMNGSETEEYQRLKQELEELEAVLNREATPAQKLSGVMVLLGSAIKSVADHALNLGKRLAKVGFNAITSSAKKAISTLKAYTAQTRKTDLANNALVKSLTSIKRLLITRIKRMFISSIFNSVREGLQQLAQFDAAFNVHMSNIKNSAKLLSNNIAILLSNIISVVEPVITKILELLSRVVDAINQVFAVLQGKSTYTSAAKGAESYAESASDAAKAQKKWNNELYSFDELNRQSKNNDSSTAGAAQTLFGEQQINLPAAVSDWIERLKAAWKAGNWYSVGKTIADGINAGMRAVDEWINNKFRPIAEEWARRIATILNGLVDGVNWPLLGKTLADGFNALIGIANNFLTTFNFLNFGKGIGAAIKSWFDNVEWENVGAFFANKWNALLHTIEGIVTTPDLWVSIGSSIGRLVKSWFTKLDFNSLASIIIALFNGVAASIRAFLAENPFAGVPERLAAAINRVIHEVNWAELGKSLSDWFKYVLGKIREAVDLIDWHGIGVAIGEFLGNIDWWGLFTQVAGIVWEAFSGVLSGLLSTDGGRMFVALFLAIKGLSTAFSLTEGLWKIAVQKWVMTGVSPLESMPELVTQIAPKLKAALAGLAKVALTGALAVFDAVMIAYDAKSLIEASKTYNEAQQAHNRETATALSNFEKLYRTKGPEVAAEWAKTCYQIDTTGMSLDQAQQALTKKVDSYWDDVPQNMWDGFKQGWGTYFGKDGKGLLGLMGDAFTGAVGGIKNLLGIHSPSTVFESIGQNVSAGFQNGFTSAWSRVGPNVLQAWTNLRTSFNNIQWNNVGQNLVAGINNGMGGSWSGLVNNVVNMANNLVSRIKSAFGIHSPSKVFAEIGGMLDAGLERGLADGERDVLQTASNIAEAVTNGMTPDSPEVDVTAEGIVGGMQAVIAGLGGIAETFKVILDSITAMGGLLTPEIAAGAIVPNKTKVDSSAPSDGDSDASTSLLAAILAELQALSRQVVNDDEQNRVFSFNVNGREIFEVIVDENNRAIRSYGKSPLRT